MGSNKRYPNADRRRQPPAGPERRHCWVLRTATTRGRWPGLILEWRRTNAGDWQARVVYVPDERRPESIEAWFAAELLRPLDNGRNE